MCNIETLKVNLILTEECNLRCYYCFDKNKEKSIYISNDTLLKSLSDIQNFINNHTHIKMLKLIIFGGEITIDEYRLSGVLEIVKNFIENLNIKVFLMVTTNGLIYSDSIVDFINTFKRNPNVSPNLAVSIGCGQKDHNITRGGNYTDIVNNIKKYFFKTNNKIIKKSVLSPYILKNFDDFLIGYDDLKSYTIMDLFLINDGIDTNIEDLRKFLKQLMNFIYDGLKTGNFISFGLDFFISILIRYYLVIQRKEIKNKAFKNNKMFQLTISPEGNYYSSHLSFFYRLDEYQDIEEMYKTFDTNLSNLEYECDNCKEDIYSCELVRIENLLFLKNTLEIDKNVCMTNRVIQEEVLLLFKRIYENYSNNELKYLNAFEKYNQRFFIKYGGFYNILKEVYHV